MMLFNKMSLADKYDHIVKTLKRFPFTFCYIIIATVYLWIFSHNRQNLESGIEFFMIFWPLSGTVFSYVVHLYSENKSRGKSLITNLLSNILWTTICVFFSHNFPLNNSFKASCVACCVAIVLALWVIPFVGQKDDRPAINFVLGFVKHIFLSLIVSLILFLGLELLIQSFIFLFDFHVEETQVLYLLTFCFFFLAPSLVVLQTPSGEDKYAVRNWTENKFMNGVIHFLVIPLHLVYLLTLYLYVIKIVLTWTLPNGWVSWLVTALMFLTIVIVYLLYPVNFQAEKKRFDQLVLRYLPIVVLPLLFLMSIGIIRRFNDYGISVLRIYLLAFNLWCYAVCIGLYVVKSKRLSWIVGSFTVLMLTLTVLPYNVFTFTRNKLQSDIKHIAVENGVTNFPMDSATYKKLLNKIGEVQGEQLSDKLYYLSSTFDTLAIDGLVDRKGVFIYEFLYRSEVKTESHFVDIDCKHSDSLCRIPKGYTSYRIVGHDYSSERFSFETKNDTMFITMDYMLNDKKVEDVISIPINTLDEMYKVDKPLPITFYGKNICFYMTNLVGDLNEHSVNLRGILFKK
nr:DUF4153 domain-containing protein [uncultured Prevotella sp.]